MAWPARGTVLGVQRRTERAASSRLRARPDPPSRPRVGGRGPGPLGWRCGSLLCSGPRLSRPRQPPGPPPTPHAVKSPPNPIPPHPTPRRPPYSTPLHPPPHPPHPSPPHQPPPHPLTTPHPHAPVVLVASLWPMPLQPSPRFPPWHHRGGPGPGLSRSPPWAEYGRGLGRQGSRWSPSLQDTSAPAQGRKGRPGSRGAAEAKGQAGQAPGQGGAIPACGPEALSPHRSTLSRSPRAPAQTPGTSPHPPTHTHTPPRPPGHTPAPSPPPPLRPHPTPPPRPPGRRDTPPHSPPLQQRAALPSPGSPPGGARSHPAAAPTPVTSAARLHLSASRQPRTRTSRVAHNITTRRCFYSGCGSTPGLGTSICRRCGHLFCAPARLPGPPRALSPRLLPRLARCLRLPLPSPPPAPRAPDPPRPAPPLTHALPRAPRNPHPHSRTSQCSLLPQATDPQRPPPALSAATAAPPAAAAAAAASLPGRSVPPALPARPAPPQGLLPTCALHPHHTRTSLVARQVLEAHPRPPLAPAAQIHKQANKQANKQTNKQTNKQRLPRDHLNQSLEKPAGRIVWVSLFAKAGGLGAGGRTVAPHARDGPVRSLALT